MGIGKVKTLVSRCCGAIKIQFSFFPLNIECFDEFYDDDVNSLMVARSENGHRLISIFATFPRIALAHSWMTFSINLNSVISHLVSLSSTRQRSRLKFIIGWIFLVWHLPPTSSRSSLQLRKEKKNSKTQLSSRINRPTDDTYTTQPLHHRHLLAAL